MNDELRTGIKKPEAGMEEQAGSSIPASGFRSYFIVHRSDFIVKG
jgi:hypothetical protein